MKTTSSELKRRAKQTLLGNYGICAGAMLILGSIVIVIALIYIGVSFSRILVGGYSYEDYYSASHMISNISTYLIFIAVMSVCSVFVVGLVKILLNLCTGQLANIGDLLYGFTTKPHRYIGMYVVNVLATLVMGIPYYIVFCMAIFTEFMPVLTILMILMYLIWLIGTAVYYLNFALVTLLLVENPEKKVFQCFKESACMMKGNKGRLLYILFSFIGIILLGYCSLGIGFIWAFPYIQTTTIHFYLDLKAQQYAMPYDADTAYDSNTAYEEVTY